MNAFSQQSGQPRFVAYSTVTRLPVLTGYDAAALLARTRDNAALGYDNRFTEVLDCGAGGPDADTVSVPLEAARSLYRTVYRGAGSLSQPGMPPLPLSNIPQTLSCQDKVRTIEESLTRLAAEAKSAGLGDLADAIDSARAQAHDYAEFCACA